MSDEFATPDIDVKPSANMDCESQSGSGRQGGHSNTFTQMSSGGGEASFLKERLLEYQCLRAELLDRIKLRHQVMIGTVILFGASTTLIVEGDRPYFGLLYPILISLVALTWIQNDCRIKMLAHYIRERFETGGGRSFYWETYVETHRSSIMIANVAVPHGGIFLGTQVISILLALEEMMPGFSGNEVKYLIYFFCSAGALVSTFILFCQKRKLPPVP